MTVEPASARFALSVARQSHVCAPTQPTWQRVGIGPKPRNALRPLRPARELCCGGASCDCSAAAACQAGLLESARPSSGARCCPLVLLRRDKAPPMFPEIAQLPLLVAQDRVLIDWLIDYTVTTLKGHAPNLCSRKSTRRGQCSVSKLVSAELYQITCYLSYTAARRTCFVSVLALAAVRALVPMGAGCSWQPACSCRLSWAAVVAKRSFSVRHSNFPLPFLRPEPSSMTVLAPIRRGFPFVKFRLDSQQSLADVGRERTQEMKEGKNASKKEGKREKTENRKVVQQSLAVVGKYGRGFSKTWSLSPAMASSALAPRGAGA